MNGRCGGKGNYCDSWNCSPVLFVVRESVSGVGNIPAAFGLDKKLCGILTPDSEKSRKFAF